jgi:hypothetical protein
MAIRILVLAVFALLANTGCMARAVGVAVIAAADAPVAPGGKQVSFDFNPTILGEGEAPCFTRTVVVPGQPSGALAWYREHFRRHGWTEVQGEYDSDSPAVVTPTDKGVDAVDVTRGFRFVRRPTVLPGVPQTRYADESITLELRRRAINHPGDPDTDVRLSFHGWYVWDLPSKGVVLLFLSPFGEYALVFSPVLMWL